MKDTTVAKYVVEIEISTDHDCWYDSSIFVQPHTSRYFENHLYEYTVDADGYGDKCRRVFDTDEQAASFVLTFMRLLAIWAAVEAGIPESEIQNLPYNEIIKRIAIVQRIDAPDVGIVMNGGYKNGRLD